MLEKLHDRLVEHDTNILATTEQRRIQKAIALSRLFDDDISKVIKERFIGQVGGAIIDHLFYICCKRAESGDAESIKKIGDALCGQEGVLNMTSCSFDRPRVADRAECEYIQDAAFSSPVFIYNFLKSPKFIAVPLVNSAIDYAIECGFELLLSRGIGLVVILDKKGAGDHIESYTLTALRGTIFMDYFDDKLRMAETLVHEAAHNWLNLAFDAYMEPLPELPTWWSPWRGVERPAAGILHGVFAFGCVREFLMETTRDALLPDKQRTYVLNQARAISARMSMLRNDLPQVLGQLKTPALRNMIEDLFLASLNE
jgi:hypothetical protein